MTATFRNWQAVQDEVLRRIHDRTWLPGDLIPNEADLAKEFGCARVTVNRALRALADAGLLDRRRKAGTRIATHPVRKVTLNIPVIRLEIEGGGGAYGHNLLKREHKRPPATVRKRMRLPPDADALHLVALHLSNAQPHALEDRWINLEAVPDAANVDFSIISANEWLVLNAPFTNGDISLSATNATRAEAAALQTTTGDALFKMERHTWVNDTSVTFVRMTFAPGYRMQSNI